MPNGAVAPGKVWPSGPVPIIGSTSLSGSGTWAKPIEQANSRVKQRHFFILRKYRILFVLGAAYPGRRKCRKNCGINSSITAADERRVLVLTRVKYVLTRAACSINKKVIAG